MGRKKNIKEKIYQEEYIELLLKMMKSYTFEIIQLVRFLDYIADTYPQTDKVITEFLEKKGDVWETMPPKVASKIYEMKRKYKKK